LRLCVEREEEEKKKEKEKEEKKKKKNDPAGSRYGLQCQFAH